MTLKRNRLSLVASTDARTGATRRLTPRAAAREIRRAQAASPVLTDPVFLRDSYASTAFADLIDRSSHAAMARFTAGLSPMTLIGAYADWAAHLTALPGKRLQLVEKALRKWLRFVNYAGRRAVERDTCEACIEPLPQDKRFIAEAWRAPPYDLIYQSFLLTQQWWHNAMTDVRGVTQGHEKIVAFATRQWLDVFAPSNFLLTNPEVLKRTRSEAGMNLLRGA